MPLARSILISLIIIPGLALCVPALAQDDNPPTEPDNRIKRILKKKKLKYTIDEDGDFKILYQYDDGRTQIGFIRSRTEEFQGIEIREIWSYAYKSESEQLPAEVANSLLADTFQNKMGAWAKDGPYALYVTKLAANAKANDVISALDFTMQVADDIEITLSGDKDVF